MPVSFKMLYNLQIINGCAGTNPGLQTAGTDPGRRYFSIKKVLKLSIKSKNNVKKDWNVDNL